MSERLDRLGALIDDVGAEPIDLTREGEHVRWRPVEFGFQPIEACAVYVQAVA